MTRYLRLLRLFFRAELQYELEYRLNFVLEIVETAVVTATSVGAVLILFSYTTVLNGWDLGAMLVLLPRNIARNVLFVLMRFPFLYVWRVRTKARCIDADDRCWRRRSLRRP